jgi:hypothetical protein
LVIREFAEAHAAVSIVVEKKKPKNLQILKMSKENPKSFSVDDLKKINSQFFLN